MGWVSHQDVPNNRLKNKGDDTITAVGSTGRSTGPHLHYEVLPYNQNLDPLDFMFDGYAVAKLP